MSRAPPGLLRGNGAECGEQPASKETTAIQRGDHWIPNGTKTWISNGTVADLALVFAQTDNSKGHHGIAAFLIEKGTPGFSTRPITHKLGLRASDTGELIFENCAVPETMLLEPVDHAPRSARICSE